MMPGLEASIALAKEAYELAEQNELNVIAWKAATFLAETGEPMFEARAQKLQHYLESHSPEGWHFKTFS